MANDCLVTKLQATVNNDNLPYLGKGIIEVDSNADISGCSIVCTISSVLKIIGSGTITDAHGNSSSDEITIFTSENFTMSAGKYKVLFDKYNVIPIMDSKNGVTINVEDFEFTNLTSTKNLYGSKVFSGDLKYLAKFTALEILYAQNSRLFGNIADLPGTALKNLTINSNNALNITGNISELAKYGSLATLYIDNTEIVGSLEGLVSAYRSSGVTTNATGINIYPNYFSKVTFNGSPLRNTNAQKVTWTASQITFNGVTVDA